MDTLHIFIASPEDPALKSLRRSVVRQITLTASVVTVSLAAFHDSRHVEAAPQDAAVAPADRDEDLEAFRKVADLRAEATRLSSQGRIEAAVAKADEAIDLIAGDTPRARQFRAALLDTRAIAHLHAGDQSKVAADSLAAAAIWRGLGQEWVESLAVSLLNAGFALIQTKQHKQAAAVLVEARDILAAKLVRRDLRLLQAFSLLSTAARETGDDPLATSSLADYVKLALELGRRGDGAFPVHLRLLGIRLLAANPPDPRQLDLWVNEAIAAEMTAADATVIREMVAKLSKAGDYERSLRLASRLADWHRGQQPRDDVALAAVLEKIGEANLAAGDFPAAKRVYREACGLLEERHPREHAIMLTHLAGVANATGEYIQAEADFTRAIGTLATLEGPDRLLHAHALGGLGMVNLQLGDIARAKVRLSEAVEKASSVGAPAGSVVGNLLVQLAMVESLAGNVADARRDFEQGRGLVATAFGADHPILLVLDQAWAGMEIEAGGDLAAAETILDGVIDRLSRLPGGGGLIRAQALETLAEVNSRRRDRDRALACLNEARAIREAGGDDRSLVFVRSLLRIAEVRGLGDPASRADVELALDLCEQLLGPAFATLSERQQIAAAAVAYRALGVAIAIDADDDPRRVTALHGRMLRWKGCIFARQHEVRQALAADQQAAAIAAELRVLAARIAAAALQPGAAREQGMVALTDRRDELERSLAEAAGQGPRAGVTTAAVSAVLPDDAALVDFLEFTPGGMDREPREKRLVAFVVRRGRDVVRVDLGAAAAVTEALATWRPWQAVAPPEADEAAATLRRLVWLPLEPHLAKATVVLVSPDGSLGELPFAALPGRISGSILLDEVLMAHVPVPSLLPKLLALPKPAAGGGDMLLVGDVDFGAAPKEMPGGPAIAPGGFPHLPGTEHEVETIAKLAGAVDPPVEARRLEGGAATVEAVRTGLATARFVHLATHGFFADSSAATGLTRGIAGTATLAAAGLPGLPAGADELGGFHPGALSGIVLAGANARRGSVDGILTALEVADLDLARTDLVVLSACDTRRGRRAAGEGLLGLQRAFEVAGAKSVVASLWQVDDDATAALMREFYRNLWQRNLPRGESLRQAQRHVAREYRRVGDSAPSRGVAGSVRLDSGGPLPPAFWAGFVLSGDWR